MPHIRGIEMKGIKYRVTYVEGMMEWSHGMSYQTDVIHIPEIRAEINHGHVRKENDDDYTKEINGVVPERLGEVEIDSDDIEKIKTILHAENVTQNIIDKYIGEDKDD